MADVRYVVLSDLHFGATNSVLTSLRPDAEAPGGYTADASVTSPMTEALLDGLGQLTGHQDTPPTLILAGDVLDLALSPDEVAANTFGGFVDRALGGDRPCFGARLYFLPGNHDHHLWEGAREAAYTATIRDLPATEAIPPPHHTTDVRPSRLPPSAGDLLSTLIRRRPGCAGIEVRVAYPNLFLLNDAGTRAQLISHGHYTESIYTLMTRLRRVLFPDPGEGGQLGDVETLEAENFAWIDFFWSTLGRSGDVGIDVARIYADLQSTPNLNVLATNLALAFAARPHNPPWLRRIEATVLGAVLRREVGHLARAERGTPDTVLSPAGKAGALAYLEGPALHQIHTDVGAVPPEIGFVFGHTHKPFVDRWQVAGYPAPVPVANTGGWVVDTAVPATCQGGAAVLLDADLQPAVVQLYRQQADGVAPPRVLAPDANPFAGVVTAALDASAAPWRAVAAAAAPLIRQRWELQANLARAMPGPKLARRVG